jgi:hypothetical protein
MPNGEFLKGKYWKREEFKKAVERSARREAGKIPPKPQEQINLYLQRLYKGLTGKELREELIRKGLPERFRRFIIYKIKKEYFFNLHELIENDLNKIFKYAYISILSQTKKIPQEEIIKQWEQETGKLFEDFKLSLKEKRNLIEQINGIISQILEEILKKIEEEKEEEKEELSYDKKIKILKEEIYKYKNEIYKNILLFAFAKLKGYSLEQLKALKIKKKLIKQWRKDIGQDFENYQIEQENIQPIENNLNEFLKNILNLNEEFKRILLGNFAELRFGYTPEQLKNPQIREEVIKQWEKETGQNFATYQIPEEEKEKIIEQVIKDQEESLNYWFDYFLSPEAENYPLEFRYWAFIEMLKCGSYDEKRRTFNERTKSTIAPFPLLNQQALAIVLDEIIRRQNKQPSQILASLQDENERKEFEKRLQAENFRYLYGFALDYVKRLVLPKERLPIIKGEWRVFKKGSDPKELVRAIQNFPTGWCIAGEGTATSYLSHSDIYIYFSEDTNGNPTIPRAAIVYNPELQRITEIRGIAKSQNLDPYIHPVVEEKLREIPQGIEWMETMQDQKRLAEIYLKHLNNQELTQEELRFIYEIDREIKRFGYERDPRIEEILRNRNKRRDFSIIFNCQEDEIAINIFEITDKTRLIYTPEKAPILEKLPSNLEYAFCSLYLYNTPIKSLGKLKRVGGDLLLPSSQIKDLEDLEEVGGGSRSKKNPY